MSIYWQSYAPRISQETTKGFRYSAQNTIENLLEIEIQNSWCCLQRS